MPAVALKRGLLYPVYRPPFSKWKREADREDLHLIHACCAIVARRRPKKWAPTVLHTAAPFSTQDSLLD